MSNALLQRGLMAQRVLSLQCGRSIGTVERARQKPRPTVRRWESEVSPEEIVMPAKAGIP